MSFDRMAPHYRWMERWFAGERLQRCRTVLLEELPPPAAVLIYGEGNGRFLAVLRRRFPAARVTVVDASARMLSLARRRLSQAGLDDPGVSFIHADALEWAPPAGAFDLVVTCFFLDCFTEAQLRHLVPVAAAGATPQARWLLADFQLAATGWQRARSRMIVTLLYAFFRRATWLTAHELVDPAPLLGGAGFQRLRHVEQDHGLLHASLWARGECVAGS